MKWQDAMKTAVASKRAFFYPEMKALRDHILELDGRFEMQCKVSCDLREELGAVTAENKKLRARWHSAEGVDLSTLLGYEAGLEAGKQMEPPKPLATEIWPCVYEMSRAVAKQVEKTLRDMGMTIPIARQLIEKDREVTDLKREVKSLLGACIRPPAVLPCGNYMGRQITDEVGGDLREQLKDLRVINDNLHLDISGLRTINDNLHNTISGLERDLEQNPPFQHCKFDDHSCTSVHCRGTICQTCYDSKKGSAEYYKKLWSDIVAKYHG